MFAVAVPEAPMNKQPVRNREWITDLLERASVVEWDRFVVEDHDGTQCVRVYGWIDREDEYKDFVIARFWPDDEWLGFTTSSDEYSEWLQAEWFGEDSLDEHDSCRRVENAFSVENAIKLTGENPTEELA